MLVRTNIRRGAARWTAALAACHDTAASLLSTCTTAHQSATRVLRWTRFFDLLHDDSPSLPSPAQHSFELAPASLLRQLGQHWVDEALAVVVAARVAEVYPQAKTSPAVEEGGQRSCAASAAVSVASLEDLLAQWSAHTLLAVLHDQAVVSSDGTVSSALAACLRADVLPVVSYLADFSPVRLVDDVGPSSVDALHRAVVLLLSSFLSAWQAERSVGTSSVAADDMDVMASLTTAEVALADELSQCLSVLHRVVAAEMTTRVAASVRSEPESHSVTAASSPPSTSLRDEDSSRQEDGGVDETREHLSRPWRDVHALRHTTRLQSEQLQAAVRMRCGATLKGTAVDGTFLQAVTTWVEEVQRRPRTPAASAFVGVTGVQPATEDSETALTRVNDALNQIALSSVAQGGMSGGPYRA